VFLRPVFPFGKCPAAISLSGSDMALVVVRRSRSCSSEFKDGPVIAVRDRVIPFHDCYAVLQLSSSGCATPSPQ
jgi:hypothetical protein